MTDYHALHCEAAAYARANAAEAEIEALKAKLARVVGAGTKLCKEAEWLLSFGPDTARPAAARSIAAWKSAKEAAK